MTSNGRDPKLDKRYLNEPDSIFLRIKLLKLQNKTVTVVEYTVI